MPGRADEGVAVDRHHEHAIEQTTVIHPVDGETPPTAASSGGPPDVLIPGLRAPCPNRCRLMIDFDLWQEILETASRNKLRSALTGFSVAWGIFMLVVLLGSGTGLQQGVEYQFRDDATNSIYVRAGRTSLPYRGMRPGRFLEFTNRDFDALRERVPGIEHERPRLHPGTTVRRAARAAPSACGRSIRGTGSSRRRWCAKGATNDLDLASIARAPHRTLVKEALFGAPSPRSGARSRSTASSSRSRLLTTRDRSRSVFVYVPVTTAQRAFGAATGWRRPLPPATPPPRADGGHRQGANRQLLRPGRPAGAVHHQQRGDLPALRLLLASIRPIWLVDCTVAGVVGVSNIMMIAVKERTREIGIRKAVGVPCPRRPPDPEETVSPRWPATSASCWAFTLEGLSRCCPRRSTSATRGFGARSLPRVVDVAGAIAGFFPARRAAAIRPVEALRYE